MSKSEKATDPHVKVVCAHDSLESQTFQTTYHSIADPSSFLGQISLKFNHGYFKPDILSQGQVFLNARMVNKLPKNEPTSKQLFAW